MKTLLIVVSLLVVSIGRACAVITGSFVPIKEWGAQAGIMRDTADGVWEAASGFTVHHVSYNNRIVWDSGLFAGHDMNSKNNTWGIFTGPRIQGPDLSPYLDSTLTALNLPDSWKPSRYIALSTSLVGLAGFRPQIQGDFRHQFVHGFMILLDGKFSFSDIASIVQKGL